ncbi:biotin transporter BioY [Haladaptatus sp. F3-133]|jgi:biotin transport system substrate-specific component|uniref:Biotin transporter BioY n=1 Tax=Halorutilus salinus TaxID=2487751 RepID=A0A9Q4C1W8_9EURY|nr:biotin transporter BioY [Halorutilus salinus]MCX2817953.1 biotin transporter BioY [Halorutilus salinus]
MEQSEKIRKMSYAAVLAALTGAGALLSIPLGPVPFTLQTFFVVLAGFILGAKWGFVAISLYLLLGSAGLPVFSGGAAGAGHLLGPTGGYLIAFPFGAAVAGFIAERGDGRGGVTRLSVKAVGALLASWLILVAGAVRLMGFYGMSPEAAFAAGIAPFVVTGLPELALAVGLSESLSRAGVASASEGPRVSGVEERSLYGVALGAGMVMSTLIPWAYLSKAVSVGGEEGSATAGVPGYFVGGETTVSGEVAGETVTASASAPSLAVYGGATALLGVTALGLAVGAVRGMDESYVAVGYGAVGVAGAVMTAVAHLNVSSWSLEVGNSVGYGVYLPALMGVGLVALAAHTVRVGTTSTEATAV